MRNFSYVPLNSASWSFEKHECESHFIKGEKIRAFVDPSTGSVCVKFIREKKS
jgi:hypothetical protein